MSVLFLMLIALSAPCAWGANYEGDFKGFTNQGYPVDLTVTANSVKMAIQFKLTGTGCSSMLDETMSWTSSQNINGNFDRVSGKDRTTGSFNANTDSWSGTWIRYNLLGCIANDQGTWQAVRHITQPNISVNPTTGTIKAFVEKSRE